MSDRNRVKDVFFGALDCASDEIERYLDEACDGDEALRREVLSLLEHHDDRELVEKAASAELIRTTLEADHDQAPRSAEDRYVGLEELGVGGAGRVTSTWDRRLRRRVARKEPHRDQPLLTRMLLHEARLLAWLDHPGAVPVYDVDAGEQASYTMRLLDGETLRARLDDAGILSAHEAVRIIARVSETMANAHAKGVLHLDLKPANIMLLPYGQVCVLDWGLARFHDVEAYRNYLRASGESDAPAVAGFAGVAGTPNYMPAEQASGEVLGPAADIFAAGTVLYEMLSGRVPHPTQGAASALDKRDAVVTPPRVHRADIPNRLQNLCLRMLAPDPSGRPASFDEVLAELDDLHGVVLGEQRVLEPGDILFREGELGEEAFQILEGSVSITVEGATGSTELATRGVGDLIGEMAIVLNAPRSATASAIERTRVAVLTGAVIAEALEGANPLLARMIRSLSDRLREEAQRARR